MITRKASAEWRGPIREGGGTVKLGSGAFEGPYSFKSRFEGGTGTNPEELLGASHAGCFSMALALMLSMAGHPPSRIHTTAKVHLEKTPDGYKISAIDLETEAVVPGLAEAVFMEIADKAKAGCPISKALAAVDIRLAAKLLAE
jgi:osmotically inducible protein OsmC